MSQFGNYSAKRFRLQLEQRNFRSLKSPALTLPLVNLFVVALLQ